MTSPLHAAINAEEPRVDWRKVTCPRCGRRPIGSWPGDTGALTRVPDRTERICSPCGNEEGVIQRQQGPGAIQHPIVWPVETPIGDSFALLLAERLAQLDLDSE